MNQFLDTWTRLATAAVTCIAPSVAWLTFWTTQRERLAERTRHRLDSLDGLREAVDAIGKWARKQYEASAHNYDWYNARIKVIELVPVTNIERFNRVMVPGDFGGGLKAAVARVQAALRRLNELVNRQNDLCREQTHTDEVLTRLSAVLRRTQERGAALTEKELAEIIPNSEDRAWVQSVYDGNRTIYTVAIGAAGGGGLHEASRATSAAMEAEQLKIQQGQESAWMRWGHRLAWVLVGIGLMFLIAFVLVGGAELWRVMKPSSR